MRVAAALCAPVTMRSSERGNVQPAPEDAFLASEVTFWESNGQIARCVAIPSS